MKKINEELFINAEEVYGKELIDKLRQNVNVKLKTTNFDDLRITNYGET